MSPLAECALARAIRVIGDAWMLLILRELLHGVDRFNVMLDDLAIPRSILADRLRRLVREGILETSPYREQGQRRRNAYRLTPKGEALIPALTALRAWSEVHVLEAPSSFRLVDEDGMEVTTVMMRSDGRPVRDLSRIRARPAESR